MSMKTLVIFALLFLAACAPKLEDSDPNPVKIPPILQHETACPGKLQENFANLRAAQDKWYQDHGSPTPTEIDKAQLSIGTNGHAVMLVHGFISAPAAMMDVANELIAAGDTVYVPLLTGYGSDAHAANLASTADWRQSVTDGVALLRLCYPDVTIVAHSLGGALVTDEIVNHNLQGVNNLVLLSPYFKLEQPWPALLGQAMAGGLDDIDVGTLQRETGVDPYGYLPLQKPKPGEPQPFLPLKAMAKVVNLQEIFDSLPPRSSTLPILLAESEADAVINGGFAAQYLGSYTSQLTRITYNKDEGIGHSIETRALNPHFEDLVKAIQAQLLSDDHPGVSMQAQK